MWGMLITWDGNLMLKFPLLSVLSMVTEQFRGAVKALPLLLCTEKSTAKSHGEARSLQRLQIEATQVESGAHEALDKAQKLQEVL